MVVRHNSLMRLSGSSRPHLRSAKAGYVHPHVRPPGGAVGPGADARVEAGARCAGMATNIFFADHPKEVEAAKEICAGCPVRNGCLDQALANDEKFGVFGGMTAKERRRLVRERRDAA